MHICPLLEMVAEGTIEMTDTPTDFVVHELWTAYPDEPGEEVSHGHTEHHSNKEVVHLSTCYRGEGQPIISHVEFKSEEMYKQYCENAHEIDQGSNRFLTQKEYDAHLAKEKHKKERTLRQEMERKCQSIQKKFKIEEVDSIEFFAKVHDLADDEQSGWDRKIQGLHEDGLCIGFGATVDQWCEEKNYMSGKRETAMISWGQLKDYLNEKFPIVAAEYRQSLKSVA